MYFAYLLALSLGNNYTKDNYIWHYKKELVAVKNTYSVYLLPLEDWRIKTDKPVLLSVSLFNFPPILKTREFCTECETVAWVRCYLISCYDLEVQHILI